MKFFNEKCNNGNKDGRKPKKCFKGFQLQHGSGFKEFQPVFGKVSNEFKAVFISLLIKICHFNLQEFFACGASAVDFRGVCEFIIPRRGLLQIKEVLGVR